MPRKPWAIPAHRVELSEAVVAFLLTGDLEPGDLEVFMLAGSRDRLQAAWKKVKRELLPAWVKAHPGTRPAAWWALDAPRWSERFGAWFDGTLPEPRRQVRGSGITMQEKYPAMVPRFSRGIPEFCEWDEVDPPAFESEAGFLRRHGLLTATEEKWLAANPAALTPEILTFEED